MLALRNKHPRDDSLVFEEAAHTYTLTDGTPLRSVTQTVKPLFPAFDADAVIARMQSSANWTASRYHGMSPADIKTTWAQSGVSASQAGTDMHARIEDHFNGCVSWTADLETEERQFGRFVAELPPGLVPYRTEWAVWDKECRLAGTIDMVFKDADGSFVLYDWKRTKRISRTNPYGEHATAPGFEYIPNSNYWHYALQLNTYKAMLERNYGATVSAMRLACFHTERRHHEVVAIPELLTETRELLDRAALQRV